MLSINMRIFKFALFLVALVASSLSSPVPRNGTTSTASVSQSPSTRLPTDITDHDGDRITHREVNKIADREIDGIAERTTGKLVDRETDAIVDRIANAITNREPDDDAPASAGGDHYDQRQNGTENYRIHVDGLILVAAPIEAVLLAAAGIPHKPDEQPATVVSIDGPARPVIAGLNKPDADNAVKPPPMSPKSVHRASLRLANLLAPFLRHVRHE